MIWDGIKEISLGKILLGKIFISKIKIIEPTESISY